jgi:hypothetical protein
MIASDIALFTASSNGRGRETNGALNKIRENILVDGFNGKTAAMFGDPVYGNDWRLIANLFSSALSDLSGDGDLKVKMKGGRKFNHDFEITRGESIHKVEFKFGGNSVDNIPEFFNPAANKPFHDLLYAEYFYDNYLLEIAGLYNLVPPPKEQYLKEIYKNTSKNPFFAKFKALEASLPEYRNQKKELVKASITAYLETVKNTTKLNTLTTEFMRSQSGKKFLIFENNKFHHDQISDAELTAKSVSGIRNRNVLVIQSAEPGTTHEMLLRWKNHLGILFPAWQISMRRLAK